MNKGQWTAPFHLSLGALIWAWRATSWSRSLSPGLSDPICCHRGDSCCCCLSPGPSGESTSCAGMNKHICNHCLKSFVVLVSALLCFVSHRCILSEGPNRYWGSNRWVSAHLSDKMRSAGRTVSASVCPLITPWLQGEVECGSTSKCSYYDWGSKPRERRGANKWWHNIFNISFILSVITELSWGWSRCCFWLSVLEIWGRGRERSRRKSLGCQSTE